MMFLRYICFGAYIDTLFMGIWSTPRDSIQKSVRWMDLELTHFKGIK